VTELTQAKKINAQAKKRIFQERRCFRRAFTSKQHELKF